ncbi:MAG TPA: DUF5606 domain-containing protein [Chitinophagaceae bacterium]|jgi:hypothetical protein|nr:DUF5606 domain-containing protein [Chitinophagaceae bacterium]
MEYSKIVSVTGLPGLFELINTKSDGAIVRSLDDKSTRFASSRIHNFSHLESIEVYTIRENVNLVEVFNAMEKAGGSLPDTKDNGAIKKYFEKTYPDIDFERVYNSDLKKMIKWYEALQKNNIEIKLSEPEPEAEMEPAAEEPAEEIESKKTKKSSKPEPVKKAAKKKKEEKEKETEDKPASSKAKKPAKKAAKKKGK